MCFPKACLPYVYYYSTHFFLLPPCMASWLLTSWLPTAGWLVPRWLAGSLFLSPPGPTIPSLPCYYSFSFLLDLSGTLGKQDNTATNIYVFKQMQHKQ